MLPPLKRMEVPTVSINSNARAPISDIVRMIPTYKTGTEETIGTGGRIQILQTIEPLAKLPPGAGFWGIDRP